MNEVHNILMGFELNREGSQLCYYDRKALEPVSIPARVGTNVFIFPTLLCKMPGKDEWHFGIEADYFSREKGGILIPDLMDRLEKEENSDIDGCVMTPGELLAVYMDKALGLTGVPDLTAHLSFLTLTTEKLSRTFVENVREAFRILGIPRENYGIQDRMESAYYAVFSQKKEICARKAALFHFKQSGNPQNLFSDLKVSYSACEAIRTTRPNLVRTEKAEAVSLPENKKERDEALASYAEKNMKNQLFSAVFLTGEGFDQSWARKSIAYLCRGNRHVFSGQNLYVRGACYASYEKKEGHQLRGFLYLGDDLVRTNVGIEMLVRGNPSYYPLVAAGTNWFDAEKNCQVILDDRDFLAFSIQSMDGRVRKICRMELPGLPKRPNRTTRLLISASCPSPKVCHIRVKDLGFGEFFESSGLSWEDTLAL